MHTWQSFPITYDEAVKAQHGWSPIVAIAGPPALFHHRPDARFWRWAVEFVDLTSDHVGGIDAHVELIEVEDGDGDAWMCPLPREERSRAVDQDRQHCLKVGEGHLEIVAWRQDWYRQKPWRQPLTLAVKPWAVLR